MFRQKINLLVILFAVFLILSVLFPKLTLADDEFEVNAEVTYKVLESGKTQVTHDITLENLFSTLYATTYTITFENIEVENIKSNPGNLIEISKEGQNTIVKLTFPDAIVGKGEKRYFNISYENSNFAVRTGEVWEITIPKLGDLDSFKKYNINLKVPVSFGDKAYISPEPVETGNEEDYNFFKFKKEDITQTGVTAGFGQFQVFSFNLSYHLENPVAKISETQIALPPDTAFQKVYLQSLEPKPVNVNLDADGNWIATYRLSPRQRVDVIAIGSVQIFAGYRNFFSPSESSLTSNLAATQYWQKDDPDIVSLAAKLKTPEAIYNYIATNLKYDYERVTPNVQRFGAVEALKKPLNAICMEFTDLFIALSRAAGIPAREINGYAYTENKDLQPLGLVADVLHSWPEYYDREKKVWIPIDPTWGSTTGGEDFFNKLDLRHFTFVIHGASDTKPYAPGSYKLGPNPQKDVFVSFGKLTEEGVNEPVISLLNPNKAIISNTGSTALYALAPKVYFDSRENKKFFIDILPPYANYPLAINIPFSILGKNTPDVVSVEIGTVKSQITTNKRQIVIYSLLALSTLFLAVVLVILIKLGKIRLDVKKFLTRSS